MDRYTVYDAINFINRKLHGGTVTESSDFEGAFDEGRRNMLKMINPPELARIAYIEQALYDQVNKYAVPVDCNANLISNIRMLSSYHNVDTGCEPLAQVYSREFDQKYRDNIFAINWNSGVKTMSIFHPQGLHKNQHLVINDVDSLTQNGTWNVGGNVVNLRLDELNHITKKASLSFDINDSSTTGYIENFTMKPVDLSEYLNSGATFEWLSLPIPKEMVSVTLTLGSNQTDLTTDYYYATVNQPHDNNEFVTGWNLLKYMMNNLNTVGNPNPKSIGFSRITFETTGKPIPGCNIDNIVVRRGVVYEMAYNSRWCLIDSTTNAWKKFTTSNSDIIPLEEDGFQILGLEVALVIQKELYANNFGAITDITAPTGA